MLLVHGARSVVQQAVKRSDALSRWILAVQARRGTNVAVVALANKIARTICCWLEGVNTSPQYDHDDDSMAAITLPFHRLHK